MSKPKIQLLEGKGDAAGSCMAKHCTEDAEVDYILRIGDLLITLLLCEKHLQTLKQELKI